MELLEDAWLGERLGCTAYTVPPPWAPPQELGPGFYQARVPASELAVVGALEGYGFRVVSTAITLAREAGALAARHDAAVRDARPDDDAVRDVAARAFSTSRFHLDPEIAPETAAQIKRDWATNCLAGVRGHRLLVAEVDGAPAGFLALIRVDDADVIDLIAVDEAHRSRGLGTALVAAAAADGRPLRVGTQAANPRATAFYERLQFVTEAADYDLHLHVR